MNEHGRASAWAPNSFALTLCLQVILQRDFGIDNRRKSEITLLHQPQYKSSRANGVGTNFGVGVGETRPKWPTAGGWGSWGGDSQPLPTN